MGNLRSVAKAFEAIGCKPLVSRLEADIKEADLLVLPGVGSFGDGMANLQNFGLIPILQKKALVEKTPFLGICLGMQLLAERGLEGGEHEGMGWIKGTVQKLEPADKALKIPHMGWNDVRVTKESPLFAGLGTSPCFYFVHSYHVVCDNPDVPVAACDYGGPFTAALQRGNIFGTQFHPEKSQKPGLQLLRNFVGLAAELPKIS